MRKTVCRRHVVLGVAAAAAPLLAGAQVFGSLDNFDVVNTTGHTAYGFEIEIEDVSFDHAGKLGSIFGYDRVFSFVGPDPGDVVRYGRPTIQYEPGFGARITYGGSVGANFTESKPFSTSGESCWPGANAAWRSTSCDHFGVSTYGTPAKITYSWLVDVGGGSIAKQPVVVPNVVFNPVYAPPPAVPPPQPAPPIRLEAVVPGQVVGGDPRDSAFWVKITQTELENNVDLGDLLIGDHAGARPEIAALEHETEIEWQVLQPGKVDEVTKAIDINAQKPSVVFSFDFYRYTGSFDDEGLVDPNPQEFPDAPGFNANSLVFVGRQIAGFNPVQPLPAVPEPQSWALMLGGLALMATAVARKRRPAPSGSMPSAPQVPPRR
jgi:hypothetical protein